MLVMISLTEALQEFDLEGPLTAEPPPNKTLPLEKKPFGICGIFLVRLCSLLRTRHPRVQDGLTFHQSGAPEFCHKFRLRFRSWL